MYVANINGVDVEISEEENAKYEAMAAAIQPPEKSLSTQVKEVEQQTLDIAEAVTSLYETMLVAGVSV